MSFTSPAPQGTETRTDQGVDWANVRGNIVAVAGGTISTIYRGLSGFGTTIIERLSSGEEIYYAEESGGGAPVVRSGQSVAQGQALAPGTGGVIEVGYWDPSTGRSAGAPGYHEGMATAAGKRFRSAIGGRSRLAGQGGASGTITLANLWIQAGGDPKVANLMAAIALAESSGQIDAQSKNTNGTIDRGLWQINSSHTQYDAQRLLSDPLYNAQAAVAIYKSQGLGAWTTYTSGAYKKYTGSASKATINYGGPNGGIVRPGGEQPAQGAQVQQELQNYVTLRDMPRTSPDSKNPFQWWLSSFRGNWNDNIGTQP